MIDTTARERTLLRQASRLVARTGAVYLDLGVPHRAPQNVLDSLLAKGLLVRVGTGFARTDAGDEAIGA